MTAWLRRRSCTLFAVVLGLHQAAFKHTDWTYATAVVMDVGPVDSLEALARCSVWPVPPSGLWVVFCIALIDVLLSSALLVCCLEALFVCLALSSPL